LGIFYVNQALARTLIPDPQVRSIKSALRPFAADPGRIWMLLAIVLSIGPPGKT